MEGKIRLFWRERERQRESFVIDTAKEMGKWKAKKGMECWGDSRKRLKRRAEGI
jgi:hypothetical protein